MKKSKPNTDNKINSHKWFMDSDLRFESRRDIYSPCVNKNSAVCTNEIEHMKMDNKIAPKHRGFPIARK